MNADSPINKKTFKEKLISLLKKIKDATPTALLLVGLACLLSQVMTAPFGFSASFLNSSKPNDFDFADFYNVVADDRPVREIDDNVIVINMENSDRAEFAAILERLQSVSPAAIGIDVLFQEPHDPSTDEWLLSSLRGLDNVVITESLLQDQNDNLFIVSERPFFADTIGGNIEFAASNLPTRVASGTVRTFRSKYPTANDPVTGFAAAVAQTANPDVAIELQQRDNEEEIINYPSREITVLSLNELADSLEIVNGKVVLIGAVSKTEDIHPTPTDNNMSGILIHAYAISTILNNNYINRHDSWVEWTIACLLCFIITLGFCVIPANIKGLVLRLTQMTLLIFVIYIGYFLFVEKNTIIDFSPSLLMITFGLFVCDLRLGVVTIYRHFRQKKAKADKTNKSSQKSMSIL